MGILKNIQQRIIDYIIKKTTADKTIDIIEVRTKSLNLTYVNLETDIKVTNTFFLPIKILEINTDIVNTSGLKVGTLKYHQAQKIKAHDAETFTTHTQISNITALFNLISKLLTLSIMMRSIGTARIKVLWFEVDIPVDDIFEIKSHQLKIIGELTPEEKAEREEAKKQKKAAYQQKQAEKREREITSKPNRKVAKHKKYNTESVTNNSIDEQENTLDIYIDENVIKKIASDLDKGKNQEDDLAIL